MMLSKFLPLFVAVILLVVSAVAAAADFRRFSVGDMEIVALADVDPAAPARGDRSLLVDLRDADAEKYLSAPDSMKNSINCFIVRIGGETILFDTGLGAGANGRLPASLGAAGISREDIDTIVITHFHSDHVGGLIGKDGLAAFPGARLMLPRAEVEANPPTAARFTVAYAGRLGTFEWDSPAAGGVVAVDASGHTPGHTVFLLDSGGGKLMIAADLVHFGKIQFPVPEVAVAYDSDKAKAIAARKRLFDRAVAENYAIASMHLPFPGVGTLSKSRNGYGFAELK